MLPNERREREPVRRVCGKARPNSGKRENLMGLRARNNIYGWGRMLQIWGCSCWRPSGLNMLSSGKRSCGPPGKSHQQSLKKGSAAQNTRIGKSKT